MAGIGLLGLAELPYTLKMFWAPMLDRWPIPWPDRRRGWLLGQRLLLLGLQQGLLTAAPGPAQPCCWQQLPRSHITGTTGCLTCADSKLHACRLHGTDAHTLASALQQAFCHFTRWLMVQCIGSAPSAVQRVGVDAVWHCCIQTAQPSMAAHRLPLH
jgi:hypothetical protein